jgi:soluble lytic murein transglycosylase-like protein
LGSIVHHLRVCGLLSTSLLCVAAAPVETALPPLERGQAAYLAGEWGDAAQLLQSAVAGELSDMQRGDARLLLARALAGLGESERALAVVNDALADRRKSKTSLTDELWWLKANALLDLDRTRDAMRALKVVAKSVHSGRAIEAELLRAKALESLGRDAAARKTYRSFLRTWPDAPEALEAKVRLGSLEEGRGSYKRARELYRDVVRLAPGGIFAGQASSALEALEARGKKPSADEAFWYRVEDARFLVRERRFSDAQPILSGLLSSINRRESKDLFLDVLELQARLLRESGEIAKALKVYKRLARQGRRPVGPTRMAHLHGLTGDMETAEKLLRRGNFGKRKYWTAVGDFRVEFGRYADAEAAYLKALGKRRISDTLAQKLAWAVTRQGKVDEALKRLAHVGKRLSKKRLWSRYWSGRALQDAGRYDEALTFFTALRNDWPLSYYGIQAYSRMAEVQGVAPGEETANLSVDAPNMTPIGGVQIQSTLHWPQSPYEADFESATTASHPAVQHAAVTEFVEAWGDVVPEAKRAAEFHRLGLLTESLEELRVVDSDLRALRKRGWGSLAKRTRSTLLDNRSSWRGPGGAPIKYHGRRTRKEARDFKRATRNAHLKEALRAAQVALGDPYATRRAVYEGGRIGREPTTKQLATWKAAYPIAFSHYVATNTREHGVPVYFLYSLMTVESTFHPGAISSSNAYGLLQVIPRTGRRIASELSLGDWVPERLLEPAMAIQMGSYYVGRLLNKFEGQEPLAAAAYNAGPHRVTRWLSAHPERPMDVFIEEIPFRQARRYTRSVIKHSARYRRIYHGDDGLYVANTLRTNHGAEPNY